MCRRRGKARLHQALALTIAIALLAVVIAGVARGPAVQGAEPGYFRVIELSNFTGRVVRVEPDGTIGPGIAGVKMNLLDPVGNIVRQVETDAAGYYTFERTMLAAQAPATIEMIDPAGRKSVLPAGADVYAGRVVEAPGREGLALEPEMFAPRADDPVDLSGIVLELRDLNGYVVMTTTTTITGSYQFEVDSGTWEVCVRPETLPAFMQRRTNDFDGAGSEHCAKALIVHDNNLDLDFGYGQ